MTEQEQFVAEQSEMEDFARLPPEQRQVTDRLRGVLAETAVTGVIRYPWPLVQPVVVQMMQQQLSKYEAEEHVEIGPARPILGGGDDTVEQLCERFVKLLSAFDGHPWTLQRLCELVLEPQKQYKRLHKLALAIEKLLLVTGELNPTDQPGPLPPLSALSGVNDAPPPPAAAPAGNPGHRQGESDGGGLVAAALDIRQAPLQQTGNAAASAAGSAVADPVGGTSTQADHMQVDAAGPEAAAATPASGAGAAAAEASPSSSSDDAVMDHEAPAAAGAPGSAPTGAVASAADEAVADVEMATEEHPALPGDHSHTNAVGGSADHESTGGS